MDITEIKERLEAIGKRLVEITQEQSQSGLDLARAQGTDYIQGVHLDPFTDWARRMRTLNTEVADLVAERKALKAEKRALTPCVCACH